MHESYVTFIHYIVLIHGLLNVLSFLLTESDGENNWLEWRGGQGPKDEVA